MSEQTKEQLQDALAAKWANDAYKRNRKKEYPSLEEQLDYIYHNGVDEWKSNIIDPIKAKHP